MNLNSPKAIIIGSGIAGMATSVRLRAAGYEVEVYEMNSYPGGKLTEFSQKGYRFDMGPSLFTMPQFVEELFKTAKRDISKYFNYHKKKTVCNYFYEDGTRFQADANIEEFASNAEKAFEVKKEEIISYFERSKKKYDLTRSLFLEKSLHKASTFLSKETIKAIINMRSLDLNSSLHSHNKSRFKDPRLVQLFDRFATYNGSDPYQTPGIMSMIPHLEQYFGTYFPKGGMHSITQSIYDLAKDIGVNFNFNTKVEKILVEKNRAVGIRIKDKKLYSDIIVSNSDVVPTYRNLLKDKKAPEKILNQPRSSSALIFYWGIKKQFPKLDLHNIFFSKDYKDEFNTIFNKKNVINDPTIYINISSKEEQSDAPKGCENWFVMINTPSNTGQDWDEIITRSRANIIGKLSRILGEDIEAIIDFESILDPRLIENKTISYQGALYGAASNNKFAAFLRHPNFSNKISNLYFCGGSVHPGGGIPLCLLSGKIVSELILKIQNDR